MTEVASVVRGDFLFRDVLLVDVGGDLKRHPRASEAELKALLNGKNVAKDQVGHWWEAQLIHYGLQRSKQKDTAKVRLSQALAQGKLKSQPPHLADMEAQMKKEYAAAVRKAAKPMTASDKGKKRGRENIEPSSAKRTKVALQVGDLSINIDHHVVSAKKAAGRTTATPKKVTKLTPSKPASNMQVTPKASRDRPKATHFSNDNIFQGSTTIVRPQTVTKPKESLAKKDSKVEQESRTITLAPARSRPSPVKREGYLFDADAMDTRADLSLDKLNITGVYSIHCPQITEQLPDQEGMLRLFMCVDNETGITWGGFEFAMKTGVIKMDGIDFGQKLNFGWRARDSWDKTLRFGKKCFGNIEFDGFGGVAGIFHSLFNEPCEFTGKRRPGPQWSGKSAYKYEQEWSAFPQEAYGR